MEVIMAVKEIVKPIILQRADPWIYKHTDGYYYFTASVPEYDRIEIRRSKTINGLAESEIYGHQKFIISMENGMYILQLLERLKLKKDYLIIGYLF